MCSGSACITSCWFVCPDYDLSNRKIKEQPPIIKIQYGDLSKEAFPKKSKGKRIVVINVNTTFDEDNKSQNSKEEMIKIITKLIDFYDIHGQGYEMFVPQMGTGMSRTGISKQDSLKILAAVFIIFSDRLQGDVSIVV